MLKSTLPAPTAFGISGAIVSTYRISVKPSARNSSSAINCGAVQSAGVFAKVTLVISGTPSAAGALGMPTRPAAAAPAAVVRKRRRDCSIVTGNLPSGSRLQLAFELVKEAPIGAFRDDLEHPIFAEAPIFVAQIPSSVPKVDSVEIRVRVAERRFTIGGSPVSRRMVGFARLVGEGPRMLQRPISATSCGRW